MDLEWSVELDLDESILVWHIATRVFLIWYVEEEEWDPHHLLWDLSQTTLALSNYMFFLLGARPYMLPYPVSRQRYVQLCYDVITYLKYTSAEDLRRVILDHGIALRDGSPVTIYPQGISVNLTLDRGALLAATLISKYEGEHNTTISGVLKVMFEVWVEMLCYTGYWCNENSHTKHLSSGGEIMTTLSLLMLYMSSGLIHKRERPQLAPNTPAADASPRGATGIPYIYTDA